MLELLSHPVTILIIGITIVLVGILVLRLHAFLALVLAAITVASMTPRSALETYAQEQLHPAAKKKADGTIIPVSPKWTESQAKKFISSPAPQRVAQGLSLIHISEPTRPY